MAVATVGAAVATVGAAVVIRGTEKREQEERE
jgi:hypothetical protein